MEAFAVKLYDCSPSVSKGLPVWPGDVPFREKWSMRIDEGESANLSSIESTVHLGSHADAPLHFRADGLPIDKCSLHAFIGPARVIRIDASRLLADGRIPPGLLEHATANLPPRVLIQSRVYRPEESFKEPFASFAPGTIDFLAERGVILVGIDTPSVDPMDDEKLLSHQRLGEHGMMNLEGLVLDHVPAGDYELIAPPLRLEGLDASPVRVVLRSST